jgi:hypothetical protein
LDTGFTLQDDGDTTKQARFNLASISTATLRTYIVPNIDTTLAGLAVSQTFSNTNVFSSGTNTFGSATGTGTNGFSSGATTTGNTKTVNVGTGGLSGSTTNITVGAVAGTSTTTMNGQTDIGGTTTSVNFARVVGAATGAAPTISAQGSDANIGLGYASKGTGGHIFFANSGSQFAVGNTASATNYFLVSGNTTTNAPSFTMQGADTNISLHFVAKGTGNISFFTGGGLFTQQFRVNNTTSAVNYIAATGAVTTGAPELSVQGSDTNINLKLVPQGTGTLQFGTYTAGVVAQAGFITITDAGGTSRRLLVG